MNTYTIDSSGTGPLVFNGNINGGATGTDTMLILTGSNTDNNAINGVISGSGTSVTKRGSGLWRLTGASGYTGGLTVSDGIVVVAANGVDNGGNASPFGTGNATVGSTAAGITGTAAILIENDLSAELLVERTVTVSAAGANSSQVVVLGGRGSGPSGFTGPIVLNRSVTLQAATSGTASFGGFWVGGSGAVVTTGSAGNNGAVNLDSLLPSVLAGVSVAHGMARLRFSNNVIDTATPVTVGSNLGAATLDLDAVEQTLSNLSFAGSSGGITNGTLRLTGVVNVEGVDHNITSLVFLDNSVIFGGSGSLLISGSISGNNGITKNGPGTITLSGSNSYSGTTIINQGTLKAGSNSCFGTGDIILNSGATLDIIGYTVSNNITNNGGTILS